MRSTSLAAPTTLTRTIRAGSPFAEHATGRLAALLGRDLNTLTLGAVLDCVRLPYLLTDTGFLATSDQVMAHCITLVRQYRPGSRPSVDSADEPPPLAD